jgi:amino acid transporter
MGLAGTLAIVVLANLITLVTTLSFSAIATNVRVGVGGAYYMISRSLGLEVGGAIGVPLFLSQVCSVTLYGFGLAESFRILWPGLPVQPAAVLITIGVGALAFRGAKLALRAQVPLLILIVLSLAVLAIGAATGPPVAARGDSVSPPPPGFWTVFAVFFPAVTGIMAGLGLSGDLRDPIRSVPRGSLAAVITGFLVYLTVPLLLLAGAVPAALVDDPLVWTRIAFLGAVFVLPGLWGAIFSSAVGSILGAPRTLQALAKDGLAPRWFARVSKEKGEPVPGLVVSVILAVAAALLGNLNAVAPVVTMFFLTVYGMVNVVASLETLSGDPSWRPQIRIPWLLSMAGGLACLAVMFLISAPAAIAAVVIEIGLWILLTRRERRARWGDARRGVYESLIRWSLIRLANRPMTPRNWRPHILVFTESVERRPDLIRFGTWFSQGRGVVTVCELVVGDLLTGEVSVLDREEQIQRTLRREGLVAFGEVDVVPDVLSGLSSVAQANGMAGLDSNTILLGWPREPQWLLEFFQVVRRLERIRKSVLIARIQPGLIPREGERRQIHIWWGGLQRNGDLMLLLAHLLTRNPEWRNAEIRILSVASNEHMKTSTEAYLQDLIPKIRIQAEATVMLRPNDRSIRGIIREVSAEADVVFLGLDIPKQEADFEKYADRIRELSEPLRTVFFVKNASLFVGKLVQMTDEIPVADETGEGEEKADPAGVH